MKKLTATIFATLLTVVSAGVANAEIASKGYVDDINDALTVKVNAKEDKANLKGLAYKDTVSAAEIDANAVTTEKILDANVTREKLAGDVTTSLGKADTAVQPSAITDMQVKTNLSDSANAVVADKDSEDKYPSVKAAHAIADAAVDGVTADVQNKADKSYVDEQLGLKEDKANKVDSAGFDAASADDTKYPSVKAVADKLATKAEASALAGKADKGTTLEEYGITDAYTKGETDSALGLKADKTQIADMLTKTEASDTYQTIGNKVDTAGFDAAAVAPDADTKYPSVKAVYDKLETKADSSELGNYATTEALNAKLDKSVYDSQVGTVSSETMGTTASTVVTAINEVNTAAKGAQSAAETAQSAAEAAQEAADGKMPKPSGECSNPTNKCVLVSNGTDSFTWEVIARGSDEGGVQP